MRKKFCWILSAIILLLLFFVAEWWFGFIPKPYYTADDFNIETVKSAVDFDADGIEDYADLLAGAKKDGDTLLSAGGRVLGVTAVADDLKAAINRAYEHVARVKFENGYCRSDIGARAMKALEK